MEFERLQHITREARAPGLRSSLLLFLNGPSYVRELLDALDTTIQRLEYEKEILRRDNLDLEGRITLAAEGGGREGWRQAMARIPAEEVPTGALDLEKVQQAAARFQPRPVHGETTMRAGVPEGVRVQLREAGSIVLVVAGVVWHVAQLVGGLIALALLGAVLVVLWAIVDSGSWRELLSVTPKGPPGRRGLR